MDTRQEAIEGALQELYDNLVRTVEIHLCNAGGRGNCFADYLYTRAGLNGYRVYDLPGDTAALQRIDRAVLDLARAMSDAALTSAAQETLSKNLFFGTHLLNGEGTDSSSATSKRVIEYIETDGKANHEAIFRISDALPGIRYALKRTITEIAESPRAKQSASRINAEGIGIVDACRYVWEWAKEKPAPKKDLNPASKFAAFLGDILGCFGNDADPRSAFRAWVRERP